MYNYIIAHLYEVNFSLFNAYKSYKVLIKVKDEHSAITVSTEIGLSGCYQLNSIPFLNTKSIYTCILSL